MRAFLGVYDKTRISEFARALQQLGWDLIATSGTQRVLAKVGIESTHFSEWTGHAELLGGRVKTLHPAIHGGLLYRRGVPQDEAEIEQYGCVPIDLVAAGFYPFDQLARDVTATPTTVIENIDVGGPAMIRAAAKNYRWVVPIIDPLDYDVVVDALRTTDGAPDGVDQQLRRWLAEKVFEHTARYDQSIATYLRNLSEREAK